MTIKEAAQKWGMLEFDVYFMCCNRYIENAVYENGAWFIPDDASKPKYDETKPATFYTKSYPKNDGSGKWIVEKGDYYFGGKSVPTDFVECKESECEYIEYQLSL